MSAVLLKLYRNVYACVCLVALVLNTFWVVPALLVAVFFKIFIPIKAWIQFWSLVIFKLSESWVLFNSFFINFTQSIDWDLKGFEGLRRDTSYFVICNHQSWVDIFVLQHVFARRIPFLYFFIKQQLLYLPVLGLAFWALGFPLMKRYSAEKLMANPKLRSKDQGAIRKSCERLKGNPVSIFSFLEGTRFHREKHKKQESPYRHLLKPKAGGLAFAMEFMGEQFSAILDVTIVYPLGDVYFWSLLTGRINRIVVQVSQQEVPKEFLQGRYNDDPFYRQQVKKWVTERWEHKDKLIDQLSQNLKPCSS